MIAGIFHQGSGLGNQLHRYVAIRVLAQEKGYEWGMVYHEDGSGKESMFKGKSFMRGDFFGKPAVVMKMKGWKEKKVTENGLDIRSYDPEFNFIEDNTLIDGEFQDPRYFDKHYPEINEWLKVEPLDMRDDVCVIGFRGGEYYVYPELGLPQEYFKEAIRMMREINPNMKFDIHTDDASLAQNFFSEILEWPDFQVTHDIGLNWRSVRYAKHLIISNSSFYIFPSLLNHHFGQVDKIIAPRYWARRNIGVWAMPSNYYEEFTYI